MVMRLALVVLSGVIGLSAQTPITFNYVYDEAGQLVKVIDSTGIVVQYVYDEVGNMLELRRSSVVPGSLFIFSVTPPTSGPLGTITISGQGFSTNLLLNAVKINGVVATVISASATMLVVTVPTGASTGPVSVTVGTSTASFASPLTIVPIPVITSLSPKGALPNTTTMVKVNGLNLTGATFTLEPAFTPPVAIIGMPVITGGGTSATIGVTTMANAAGTFALVAANPQGSSSGFITSSNSFTVVSAAAANLDSDGDGLSDALEITLGTDPFNSDSDGDGFSDGVEVASGSDPLNSSCTPLNCRIAGGESDSVQISILNTTLPAGSFREADGVIFSLLNTVLAPSRFNEADSVTFSLLNTKNLGGALNEVDSVPFSICNNSSGVCPGFTRSSVPQAPLSSREVSPGAPGDARAAVLATGPRIVASVPNIGSDSWNKDTPIRIVFSEPIDPETLNGHSVQIRARDELVAGNFVFSSDFRIVSIVADLPSDTSISVLISSEVESLLGVPVSEYQMQFWTASTANQRSLFRQFPPSGAGEVEPNTSIVLVAPRRSTNVSLGAVRVVQDGDLVEGSTRVEDGTIRFVPSSPLRAGTSVVVSVLNGEADSGVVHEGVFTIAGTQNPIPTPTKVSPGRTATPNTVIEVEFDRDLEQSSVTSQTALLLDGSGKLIGADVSLRGRRIVQLKPRQTLAPDSLYTYELRTELRDLSGASLPVPVRRVLRIRPAALGDDTNVKEIKLSEGGSGTWPVTIRFESAINPISITPESVRLSTADGGFIPAIVQFGDAFREVIVTPLQLLPEGTKITLIISGILNSNGTEISPKVFHFNNRLALPPTQPKAAALRGNSPREASGPDSIVRRVLLRRRASKQTQVDGNQMENTYAR